MIYTAFIFGLVLLAISFLIPLDRLKNPLQLVSIIIMIVATHYNGVHTERIVWQDKMIQAQLQIAELELKSQQINTVVVTEYIPKIKYIDRIQRQVVKEFVTVEADSRCEIPNGFVRLHDSIVDQVLIQPEELDTTIQSIKLSDVGETVKFNYQACQRNALQLQQLQQWIKAQELNWNSND